MTRLGQSSVACITHAAQMLTHATLVLTQNSRKTPSASGLVPEQEHHTRDVHFVQELLVSGANT